MIISVTNELLSFCKSTAIGVLLGVIYDFARSFGYKAKCKAFFDTLMWCVLTFSAIMLWYTFLEGRIRVYLILGCFLGGLVYFLTLSKAVYSVFLFAVKKIYCFFNIILKFLLTLLDFLGKIIHICIGRLKNLFSVKIKEDESYEKA